MKNYSIIEIKSLITKFKSLQLPKNEWTHEAHLVVSIWYCSKHNFEQSLKLVKSYIRNYNAFVGIQNNDKGRYHESITRFWLWVAYKFLKDTQFESISRICNDFKNSSIGKRDYPFKYYTYNHLFSKEARNKWVEPDIKKIDMQFIETLSLKSNFIVRQ